MDYIKAMDKNGKYNNWVIEFDMGDYYEVFCGEHITVLRKDKCFMFEGKVMSNEIRNLHDKSNKIYLGDEECTVCRKRIRSLDSLMVLENSDRYICRKCAMTSKLKAKPVRN